MRCSCTRCHSEIVYSSLSAMRRAYSFWKAALMAPSVASCPDCLRKSVVCHQYSPPEPNPPARNAPAISSGGRPSSANAATAATEDAYQRRQKINSFCQVLKKSIQTKSAFPGGSSEWFLVSVVSTDGFERNNRPRWGRYSSSCKGWPTYKMWWMHSRHHPHCVASMLRPTRILPLHSSLSPQEQNAVFQKMPPGHRKIVVSTNIAETSVTIEDVVFVIDTCRVKENSYDEASHMNVLEEMWASKANCRQRRGRAGRVRAGVCYHLVSKFTMDRLPDYMTPEMQKMSLEDTILQILALGLGNPYQFLRSALLPPEDVAITNGVLYLEGLSAVVVSNLDTSLNLEGKDITCDLDCEITPLGYHLAALPINPRIGKLILYGVLLHCIDPILTIASTESVKSVFTSPFGAKELADEAKLRFLDGNSDLLTSANAFSTWKALYDSNGGGKKGGRDGQSEGEFCRANFLGMNSLRLVEQMRQQFLSLLKDIGFMPANVTLGNIRGCPQNSYGQHIGMIKCAICAGLSPNILLVPELASKNAGKKLAEISLQSRAQGTMKVHPASVMSEAKSLDSAYIVYLEAMRTSQVYVRDVTTIPALTLAMFSGRSKVNPYSGAVVVDGWLRFRTPNLRTASCIARIRDSMEDAFMQKVLEPASETSPRWNAVLRCIENTVAST